MKKILAGIGLFILTVFFFGMLGTGCEQSINANRPLSFFIETWIISGIAMTLSLMLMFGAFGLFVYCVKIITKP